uniref:Uncharacterized protein n=1 Tax=Setaria viridis TaxID=4556 RepID=A0A4U6W5E4_SETVI|nr:hypothetical protein SEVIR_1G060850v2 [Setaria viridis]
MPICHGLATGRRKGAGIVHGGERGSAASS